MDGGVGRYHVRRKDRLVQCAALALHQLAATHRGRRLPVPASQHHQRPRWAIGSPTVGASSSMRSISSILPATTRATLTVRCSPPTPCSPCAFPRRKFRWRSARTDSWTIRCIRMEPMAVSAHARRTARCDRRSGNGRQSSRRAVPAFTPPSANYDWTGFYVGGFGEVQLVANTMAAPSTLQRAPRPLPSTATCRIGTAAFSWVSTT